MKRLVLLGGGHAHLQVLADLARRPLAGWQVTLVTPSAQQIYSGRLPGWIAGHHSLQDCAIALPRLAQAAGAALHLAACTDLDLQTQTQTQTLGCDDGTRLAFNVLSIDTGPAPAWHELPGSAEHALPVRPMDGFVAAWPSLLDSIARHGRRDGNSHGERFSLLVVGAGAAGVELAFAIQRRVQAEGCRPLALTLVGTQALPLPGLPAATRQRAARLLAERGIAWHGEQRATHLSAQTLHFDGGASLPFDACLVCTGAAAPAWPAAAGLAVDAQGFIRVTRTLQSLSHANVFAAGDVAAYADPRPKSGVFAVRAGPVLAANLRAVCAGRETATWTPQARALYLISTGEKHALATWGGLSWSGRWVWHWKNRIDSRFMRQFM